MSKKSDVKPAAGEEPSGIVEAGKVGDVAKLSEGPRRIEAVDAHHAPIISFDGAPVLGAHDGTIRLTLVAHRSIPGGGGVRDDVVVVGYLRCGYGAARDLRDNLDKAILLAAPTQGKAQ